MIHVAIQYGMSLFNPLSLPARLKPSFILDDHSAALDLLHRLTQMGALISTEIFTGEVENLDTMIRDQ